MIPQSNKTETQSKSLPMGVMFIILGSSSYGMLSTFVKLAYQQGFTTAEVTAAQVGWGAVILTIMSLFLSKKAVKPSSSDIKSLLIAGIPIGLTSVLYYLSVKYIDASVAVVLLMQSVWMGVIVESVIKKKFPSAEKVLAVILILFGTLLATKVLGSSTVGSLDPRGVILGMFTAMSFSWTLFATSSVASHLEPIERSKYMLYGGTVVVLIFTLLTQIGPHYLGINLVGPDFISDKAFDPKIFLTYGLIVGIFGTVIPPIMLNKGFPIVGVGLGSILSSMELPVAITIAYIFLGEAVGSMQWLGVVIILAAIVLMNIRMFVGARDKA